MPATPQGWVVRSAADWAVIIRDLLDVAIGFPLDYDGTIEGDWTATIAEILFRVDQGVQLRVDAWDPRTATGGALDAAVAPLRRLPAVKSRYTVDIDTDVLITAGAQFRDPAGQTWVAIATHPVGGSLSGYVVEALDVGVIAMSQGAPSELRSISALPAPATLTYTPGDDYSVGRESESDSALRRRWTAGLARPLSPTAAGMYRTIRAIPWIEALSIQGVGPGSVGISIAPEPVGTDRIAEVAAAIASCVGAGTVTTGTESATTDGPDGYPITVRWSVADTQTVAVVVVTARATGVALDAIEAAVEDAVRSAFDPLVRGVPLRRLQVLTLLGSVAGMTGCTLTLAGSGSADVLPASSSKLLVPGTITIS